MFFENHGFPQCIGAIDGTYVGVVKLSENPADYINRKGSCSLNWQTVAGHKYCVFDVVIRWPGSVHEARIFSNSSLNQKLRDGNISNCEKVIVKGRPAVSHCTLGDLVYQLFPFLMKEFANGERYEGRQFWGSIAYRPEE